MINETKFLEGEGFVADEKGIVLDSWKYFEGKSAPISLRTWIKIYNGIAACIILLVSWMESCSIGDAIRKIGIEIFFLIAIVFIVIIVISRMKHRENYDESITDIRSMKFKLTASATDEEVYNKIESELPQMPEFFSEHITLKRESDKVIVIFKGAIYEIEYEIILNGDGTFSVIGKSSSSLDNKRLYEEIREGTPIIAYYLQKSFGIN